MFGFMNKAKKAAAPGRRVYGSNELGVEVGAGCKETGGRTFLRIFDLDSAGKAAGKDGSITIMFDGNSELLSFLDALKFSVRVLQDQAAGD